MEEQTITITVKTKGDRCVMTDEQIREWYEKSVASLFNPEYGTPVIDVKVERSIR